MNTENNKRYMTTEENILNAYNRLASSKRVDQITVSDICRMFCFFDIVHFFIRQIDINLRYSGFAN